MSQQFTGKLCLVTGGSSGIGLAIAEGLAAQGARLLLVARDADGLQAAARRLVTLGADEVQTLSADLTRDEDVAKLAPLIATMAPAADLVVNCAGIVSAGLLHEVPLEEWRRLHEVNVLGVVRVLQAVLPAMLARAARGEGAGHIVNVASAAGLVGIGGMSAYGATKAAVVSLSEVLRSELRAANIGVTAVCPGFVKTPIAGKLRLFGRMDQPRTQQAIQNMFERNDLDAETVARKTLQGVRRNRAVVVVGRDAVSGYWTKRIAPGVLARMMARMTRPLTRAPAVG